MYRTEHPDPQFERANYECLNGTWDFAVGKPHGRENCALDGKIEVPFCPESKLSGIGVTNLICDCLYSREITVLESDLQGRLVLRFGAVDYSAQVFVNGRAAGGHTGGYTAFGVEITPFVHVGKNRITVAVHDDVRENVPSGKQTAEKEAYGCFYTRVTGIWQTVWLERTPKAYIRSVTYVAHAFSGKVTLSLQTEGKAPVDVAITFNGKEMGRVRDTENRGVYDIRLAETHLWEIGRGGLYNVTLRYGDDEVKSYFGLRDVKFEGRKFFVNGKSVFQRLVLDQGYYPDGLYTAPSAEDIRRDVAQALAFGFNGVRLHQKVFEPRHLYECDRAGLMVWGEYASWGVAYHTLDALDTLAAEWTETVEQFRNHPSIVLWCPLNEAWSDLKDAAKVRDIRFVESMYRLTKRLDGTRPCVDASGGYHGKHTDLFDFHCYHTPEEVAHYIQALEEKDELIMDTLYPPRVEQGALYDGKLPVHASEYGGVAYNPDGRVNGLQSAVACVRETSAWGYRACDTETAFLEQYVNTTQQLLSCKKLCGFCYTQLYDIEQEQNGLLFYDRTSKWSEAGRKRIIECNRQIAAVERENARQIGGKDVCSC